MQASTMRTVMMRPSSSPWCLSHVLWSNMLTKTRRERGTGRTPMTVFLHDLTAANFHNMHIKLHLLNSISGIPALLELHVGCRLACRHLRKAGLSQQTSSVAVSPCTSMRTILPNSPKDACLGTFGQSLRNTPNGSRQKKPQQNNKIKRRRSSSSSGGGGSSNNGSR